MLLRCSEAEFKVSFVPSFSGCRRVKLWQELPCGARGEFVSNGLQKSGQVNRSTARQSHGLTQSKGSLRCPVETQHSRWWPKRHLALWSSGPLCLRVPLNEPGLHPASSTARRLLWPGRCSPATAACWNPQPSHRWAGAMG